MALETIRNPGFGDPRTDVYAVGAVGYELLTAQQLFEGRTPEEIWRQQQFIDPILPSQRSERPVSAALEALILRRLVKDPNDRPQDMGTVVSALQACPGYGDRTPKQYES